MHTATTIREARERRGLSKTRLARLVGVSRQALILWEHGERHPRPAYAERLEAVLGLDPGALKKKGDDPAEDRRPITVN